MCYWGIPQAHSHTPLTGHAKDLSTRKQCAPDKRSRSLYTLNQFHRAQPGQKTAATLQLFWRSIRCDSFHLELPYQNIPDGPGKRSA